MVSDCQDILPFLAVGFPQFPTARLGYLSFRSCNTYSRPSQIFSGWTFKCLAYRKLRFNLLPHFGTSGCYDVKRNEDSVDGVFWVS